MMILGNDPGMNGAIAAYRPHDGVLQTFAMPVLKPKASSGKRVIDDTELARLVDAICRDGPPALAVIEAVGPRPTDGAVQGFQFGAGFGVLRGVIAANFIPVHLVAPQTWKRRMGIPAGSSKDASRLMASRAFPRAAGQWALKSQDGHAEAALLALYGWRHVIQAQGATA